MTPAIKPILKYPGAKWSIADWIVSHLPSHVHYVEPYAGSLGVYLNKQPAPHEVINDLDERLVNLFRVVRTQGDELARLIELTPYARSEYYESHERSDDPLEDARRFLVRCWQAHGSDLSCRPGWRNNGKTLPRGRVPVAQQWRAVPERIKLSMLRLRNAEIENRPALEIIDRYKTTDTLLYCDPPYPLSTRNGRMYAHEMTDADHAALLDALDAHPGPVVLSGYACPLYDDRLGHWYRVTKRCQAEKGNIRTEVLWLNDKARPRTLFDYED